MSSRVEGKGGEKFLPSLVRSGYLHNVWLCGRHWPEIVVRKEISVDSGRKLVRKKFESPFPPEERRSRLIFTGAEGWRKVEGGPRRASSTLKQGTAVWLFCFLRHNSFSFSSPSGTTKFRQNWIKESLRDSFPRNCLFPNKQNRSTSSFSAEWVTMSLKPPRSASVRWNQREFLFEPVSHQRTCSLYVRR